MPCDGVAETIVRPGVSVPVIVTPVAALGPRLVARTVNVTVSPTSASARSTDVSIARSAAAATLVVLPLESLAGFGSGSLCPVFTARFVMDPGSVAVAVITS